MPKTILHLLLILSLGVGLGLAVRTLRSMGDARTAGRGPGPGDEVFGNAGGFDDNDNVTAADIESSEPTKPPEDEAWLSRFELTERSGETVTSEQLKGQPYIVSFFFSTCPSICVTQNQILKELQDEYEGRGVKFVAISVDPETDTPDVLREYAARFGADEDQWLFLTGDLTYIRRIGSEIFRQPVDKQFHDERFALVDPEGNIEGYYSWPQKRQLTKLREAIDAMLADLATPSGA